MEFPEIVEADLSEISSATIEQGARLFGVLSHEDAVRIFLYAERGISNSTQAIKALHLTQKRYYSRLKGLLDVGLIEKIEGSYRYTALGKVIHRLGIHLIGVLNNLERIELLNNLYRAKTLSREEIKKVESMMSKSGDIGGLLNTVLGEKTTGGIKEIITYEELVETLINYMNGAQKSILLASKYSDTRVIDSLLKAIKRDVVLRSLVPKEGITGRLNKLRMMLSPKLMKAMIEFFNSPVDMNELIRQIELPFSFCVIDEVHCFFEFPSIVGSDFSIAFLISDENISKKFIQLFGKLWEMGEMNSVLNFFQK